MIRTVFLLAMMALIGGIGYWSSLHMGEMSFQAFGYHISTNCTMFIVILLTLQIIMFQLAKIVLSLLKVPSVIVNNITQRFKSEPLIEIENLMLAVFSDDVKAAQKAINNIEKLKLSPQLYNILKLEATSLSSDDSSLKNTLNTLKDDKKTNDIGMNGLLSMHESQANWSEVLDIATKINMTRPRISAVKAQIKALMMMNKWQELLDFINSKQCKTLEREQIQHIRLISYFKLAYHELIAQNIENANQYTLACYKECKHFLPNIALMCTIAHSNNDHDKAIKLIRDYWKFQPSFELTNLLLECEQYYDIGKYYKLVKSVTSANEKHYESCNILGYICIKQQEYDKALEKINQALQSDVQFRAALLMAEYYLKAHGNVHKSIEWQKKATHAKMDFIKNHYYLDFETLNISQIPVTNNFMID